MHRPISSQFSMPMRRSLLWIITLSLPILFLGLLAYLLKDSVLPFNWSELKASDLINLGALAIGFFGAFVAIGSLFVAVTQLQQATKDGEEQRKSLDASRVQLQAVVDAANKQQEILNQNLETTKAQQEILTKNLETSKSQLKLLEEQWKREQERQARKPIAEIALLTATGPKLLEELDKLPEIDFPLDHGKRWERVVFLVRNKGKVEIIKPTVRIVSSQDKVSVDDDGIGPLRAGGRLRDPAIKNEIQFSGDTVSDIEPVEIAGGGYRFAVDITIPDTINAFDLSFLLHGKNLPKKAHTLHFKVIRLSS